MTHAISSTKYGLVFLFFTIGSSHYMCYVFCICKSLYHWFWSNLLSIIKSPRILSEYNRYPLDIKQFREASKDNDDATLFKIMANYGTWCNESNYSSVVQRVRESSFYVVAGEEVVTALGSEVDRLEKEIQQIVPGIRHVDIEAHNPIVPSPP